MPTYTAAEIQTMAYGLLGEAEAGGITGMTSVAHVVRNRTESGLFSGNAYDVMTQPGEFSTFNEGAGGNQTAVQQRNPVGSARYNQALDVVTAVLVSDTRPADPTGGSIFYHAANYNASGWWNTVKTGYGTLSDGLHTFYAREPQQVSFNQASNAISDALSPPVPLTRPSTLATTRPPTPFTNAAGESYVTEVQWNGYGDGLKPGIVTVLNAAQALVDFPITLSSGARDPSRNKAAGGVGGSQHLTGNAVDISLKGLTNDQRTQLVRALAQTGALRIGAYSGNTGLHVDMGKGWGVPKGYSVYPMFDKSFFNMGGAPKWFINGLDGGLIPPRPIPNGAPQAITAGAAAVGGYFGTRPQTPAQIASYAFPQIGLPVDETLDITPVLTWDSTNEGNSVLVDRRPQTMDGVVFDPERNSFVLSGIKIDELGLNGEPPVIGPRAPALDLTALEWAMSAARPAGPVDQLYAGIIRPEGGLVLGNGAAAAAAIQNFVRPAGPAGGLPAALQLPDVNMVRPEGPVGGMPAAQGGTTITGRPDAPIGSMPAAQHGGTMVTGRPDAPIGSMPAAPLPPMVTGRPDAPIGTLPLAPPVPTTNPGPPISDAPVRPLTTAEQMAIREIGNHTIVGGIARTEVGRIAGEALGGAADQVVGGIHTVGRLFAGDYPEYLDTVPTQNFVRPAVIAPNTSNRPLTAGERIDNAVAVHRGYEAARAVSEYSRPVAVVGGPARQQAPAGGASTPTGSVITVAQRTAISEVRSTAYGPATAPTGAPLTVAQRNAIASTGQSSIQPSQTTIVRSNGSTSTSSQAGSAVLPPTYRPPASVMPATPPPATRTITVTETRVVNMVRPAGPIASNIASNIRAGGAAAGGAAPALSAPTQTIDPTMRNAMSDLTNAVQAPIVHAPPPKPRMITVQKTITVKRRIVVPAASPGVQRVRVADPRSPSGASTVQTFQGSSTGKSYNVGQTYAGTNGYLYQAQADGSFKRVGRDPSYNPTPNNYGAGGFTSSGQSKTLPSGESWAAGNPTSATGGGPAVGGSYGGS